MILLGLFFACTPALSAEFSAVTLLQLNQLERSPEVYLKGPDGSFLVTSNTRLELSLKDGKTLTVLAAEVCIKGERVILRGREQYIELSQVSSVRYTGRY